MEIKEEKKLVPFVILARYYNTTLTNKFINRKPWVNPIAGEIRSNLPGTIVKIEVEIGDRVKKGQLLLVHEAMKMENRIIAPCDGIVSEIGVRQGEKIKKDTMMVKIS